jgi:hypothetical protein
MLTRRSLEQRGIWDEMTAQERGDFEDTGELPEWIFGDEEAEESE